MGTWRRHSREFKQQAVERMKRCENIHALAKELGVERKLLYTWKYQFEGRPEKNHASYGEAAENTVEIRLRKENQELKQALGTKAAELDFFVGALRRVRQLSTTAEPGERPSMPKSGRKHNRKDD